MLFVTQDNYLAKVRPRDCDLDLAPVTLDSMTLEGRALGPDLGLMGVDICLPLTTSCLRQADSLIH